MVDYAAGASRRSCVKDPDIETFYSSTAAASAAASNTARFMVAPEAARGSAQSSVAADREAAAPEALAASRASGCFLACRRRSASAAAGQEQLRLHAAGPGHGRSSTRRRRSWSAIWRSCPGLHGRLDRPADQESARQHVDRPRPGGGAGLNWTIESSALYNAFGPQLVVHDLRADQPVPGAAGAAAEIPGATPTSLKKIYFKSDDRAAGAARTSVTSSKETRGPQSINHSGQLAVGHDLVRPQAGRLARRGDRRDRRRRRSQLCPPR